MDKADYERKTVITEEEMDWGNMKPCDDPDCPICAMTNFEDTPDEDGYGVKILGAAMIVAGLAGMLWLIWASQW